MRLTALLVFIIFLNGCGALPGVSQVQGAVVIGTDKTIEEINEIVNKKGFAKKGNMCRTLQTRM